MHEEIIKFLNKSHTQFHSVKAIKEILDEYGFKELKEGEYFDLNRCENYYVIRNLTSIIAFRIGEKVNKDTHFQIVASHSDSPTFKIKEHIFNETAGINKLIVEPYGGMIHSCWLDKPLSIAGRIVVNKDNKLESRLISFDKDLCIIPNLAIHMNREINSSFSYNPQIDLCPILGMGNGKNMLEELLTKEIEENESLSSYDLYLYNREEAKVIGINDDFIAASKLDDLASAFSALQAFIQGHNQNTITVFACFDNEEVGSMSINGANSNFLDSVLRRIYLSLFSKEEGYYEALAKSSLISADNAHAIHPNHPEKSETNSSVLLNQGVVVKYNANMHYCSDALSASMIKYLAKDKNLEIQEFYNRSDVRGGSTLGNISISQVSILSVDIGLPQLAMHSSYETMGSKDYIDMINLLRNYYDKNIIVKGENITFE